MPNFSAYTLARLLEGQQAVIARDMASPDRWGADDKPNFQPHLTVPCVLWWAKGNSTRSANRTYVNVTRDVPVKVGGMLLPSGTDVTEEDQITQVNRWDAESQAWVLWVTGIFEISSVVSEGPFVEIDVLRPHLGA